MKTLTSLILCLTIATNAFALRQMPYQYQQTYTNPQVHYTLSTRAIPWLQGLFVLGVLYLIIVSMGPGTVWDQLNFHELVDKTYDQPDSEPIDNSIGQGILLGFSLFFCFLFVSSIIYVMLKCFIQQGRNINLIHVQPLRRFEVLNFPPLSVTFNRPVNPDNSLRSVSIMAQPDIDDWRDRMLEVTRVRPPRFLLEPEEMFASVH